MKLFNWILVLALTPLAGLPPAVAREPAVTQPALLAAAPGLDGPYARTVVLALPTGGGTHIGFMLNRPTTIRVSAVFPEIASARQVASPVFAGGPQMPGTIIALTLAPHAPAEDAVEVLPGLFMAFGHEQAARAAARFPGRSRFYAGFVAWESGELQAQLDAGAWQVLEPDVDIVIGGSADTLWQRVLERTRSMLALR